MNKTKLAALIGAGLAASVSTSAIAANSNPLGSDTLQSGYNLADNSDQADKDASGSCGSKDGSGSCGAKSDESNGAADEGSSDDAMANDADDSGDDSSDDSDKSGAGKCGAGKCGA